MLITNLYFLYLSIIVPAIKAVIIPNKLATAAVYVAVLSFILYKAIYELKIVPKVFINPTIHVKLINNFKKLLFDLNLWNPSLNGIG